MEQKNTDQPKTAENGDIIYRNNRELFYDFDKEKNCFTRKVDYQYQANQVIIKQGWDVLEERITEIKNCVIRGELSPLAYYMEKSQMEVPMLSDYAGFAKWRVRKHLKPRHFRKLSNEKLAKYASVLDITIEQLVKPDFVN